MRIRSVLGVIYTSYIPVVHPLFDKSYIRHIYVIYTSNIRHYSSYIPVVYPHFAQSFALHFLFC